ncbi:MAG TPA: pyridoxamine 5'-phosphate oxidase family protein [Acidimicrobiales bacterium]|nr:pyridoxamine 5'-phosphate oxidase family protein [Acidimicrobiales bacterium]
MRADFGSFDGRDRRREVRMSPAEIDEFLRTCTNQMVLVTGNPDGSFHAVPMGYGYMGGHIYMKSKLRAQKVTNLRRNPRATCMVCDGTQYDELRGVQVKGEMQVVDDPVVTRAVTLDTMCRHDPTFVLDEAGQELVSRLSAGYVALRLDASSMLGWDHRKLGAGPPGG